MVVTLCQFPKLPKAAFRNQDDAWINHFKL